MAADALHMAAEDLDQKDLDRANDFLNEWIRSGKQLHDIQRNTLVSYDRRKYRVQYVTEFATGWFAMIMIDKAPHLINVDELKVVLPMYGPMFIMGDKVVFKGTKKVYTVTDYERKRGPDRKYKYWMTVSKSWCVEQEALELAWP